MARGEQCGEDGGQTDHDLPPSRDGREGSCGFHRFADEAQVIHRPSLHLWRIAVAWANREDVGHRGTLTTFEYFGKYFTS